MLHQLRSSCCHCTVLNRRSHVDSHRNTGVLLHTHADFRPPLLLRYGMLDPNIKDKEGLPLTCRAVFIVGPDKKLKLSLNYPASVGRNMDEIVRVVDALQLSAKYSVVRSTRPPS
jgi:1-Cys peroxiredoxin 6